MYRFAEKIQATAIHVGMRVDGNPPPPSRLVHFAASRCLAQHPIWLQDSTPNTSFRRAITSGHGCVEDVRTQMRASDVSGNKRKRRTKFSTVRLKRRARKFPQAEQTMETCTTNGQAVAPYDTSFEPCSDKRRALTNQCMRKSFDCETSHRILCVTNCTDQRSTDHVHGMRGGSRHRDVLAE